MRYGILGPLEVWDGGRPVAAAHLTTALELHRTSGNQHGQALTLTWLGEVELARGRLDEARRLLTEALHGYERIGDRGGQAVAHQCLSTVDCAAGRPQPAYHHAQSSLGLARDTGDRLAEATALNALGTVHRTISCDTATRRLEIEALIGLAASHGVAGKPAQAYAHASAALGQATRHGYRAPASRARDAVNPHAWAHRLLEQGGHDDDHRVAT